MPNPNFVPKEPEGWLKELGNDPESGAKIAQDAAMPNRFETSGVQMPAAEDSFHNQRPPQNDIQYEKPEHRIVLTLKMQSLDNREIAAKTGYSVQHVMNILRQPWAIEWMVKEAQKRGQNELELLLKGEAVKCIKKLVDLRDAEVRPEVQLAATNSLMDRIFGKAAQPVLHGKMDQTKLSDAELEKMAAGDLN